MGVGNACTRVPAYFVGSGERKSPRAPGAPRGCPPSVFKDAAGGTQGGASCRGRDLSVGRQEARLFHDARASQRSVPVRS